MWLCIHQKLFIPNLPSTRRIVYDLGLKKCYSPQAEGEQQFISSGILPDIIQEQILQQ